MRNQVRNCDRCGKPFVEPYKEYLCRDCLDDLGQNATYHTNADHIRSMTDEELAEFIATTFENGKISVFAIYPELTENHCGLDWLREAYKEET